MGLFRKIENWCLYPCQFFSLWYKRTPSTFHIMIKLNLRLLNCLKVLLKDAKFALVLFWSNFGIFQPILEIRVSRWGFLRFGKPFKHISELWHMSFEHFYKQPQINIWVNKREIMHFNSFSFTNPSLCLTLFLSLLLSFSLSPSSSCSLHHSCSLSSYIYLSFSH